VHHGLDEDNYANQVSRAHVLARWSAGCIPMVVESRGWSGRMPGRARKRLGNVQREPSAMLGVYGKYTNF
jgi:hypothetical protein